MNAFNRVNLIKKVAVLLAVTSISSLISLPVLAQSSPRPTIFSEAPYNRQDGAKPKPPGKKHGKHPGKHEHGGPGHPGKHEHGGPGHPPGDRGPKHPPLAQDSHHAIALVNDQLDRMSADSIIEHRAT